MHKSEKVPNLVFLVMEGFGHAYTSPKGYIGNFTPYLDSLSSKGLYWENSLSSAGRTFGALPSLTGSLPFGKNGFLEIEKHLRISIFIISLKRTDSKQDSITEAIYHLTATVNFWSTVGRSYRR